MSRAADELLRLAAGGRLYPSVIVSGGTADERRDLAFLLGRALLCEREPEVRPCGECRHCRRIDADRYAREAKEKAKTEKRRSAGEGSEMGVRQSHPDVLLLERPSDKRDILIDMVRPIVRSAQMSPYEARGQVFVIAEANTLNANAADVLLKTLEEPVGSTPRHFLLLAASAQELLPTLRSRSLTVYLGGQPTVTDDEAVAALAAHWRRRPDGDGFAPWVSALTDLLVSVGGKKEMEDVRARGGWTRIAATVVDVAGALDERGDRAAALAFATDLLDAHRLRERYIQPRRIVEGLAVRRLRRDRPETGFESSVNVLMGPP